jgi:hypothetical protein
MPVAFADNRDAEPYILMSQEANNHKWCAPLTKSGFGGRRKKADLDIEDTAAREFVEESACAVRIDRSPHRFTDLEQLQKVVRTQLLNKDFLFRVHIPVGIRMHVMFVVEVPWDPAVVARFSSYTSNILTIRYKHSPGTIPPALQPFAHHHPALSVVGGRYQHNRDFLEKQSVEWVGLCRVRQFLMGQDQHARHPINCLDYIRRRLHVAVALLDKTFNLGVRSVGPDGSVFFLKTEDICIVPFVEPQIITAPVASPCPVPATATVFVVLAAQAASIAMTEVAPMSAGGASKDIVPAPTKNIAAASTAAKACFDFRPKSTFDDPYMFETTKRRSNKKFTIPYDDQKLLLFNIAGPTLKCKATQYMVRFCGGYDTPDDLNAAAHELKNTHGIDDVDMCSVELDNVVCFGKLGACADYDELAAKIKGSMKAYDDEEKEEMRQGINQPPDFDEEGTLDIPDAFDKKMVAKIKRSGDDNHTLRQELGLPATKPLPTFWQVDGQTNVVASVGWDMANKDESKPAWTLRPYGAVIGRNEGGDYISDKVQHVRKDDGQIHNIKMYKWTMLDWIASGALRCEEIHATQMATDLFVNTQEMDAQVKKYNEAKAEQEKQHAAAEAKKKAETAAVAAAGGAGKED